MSSATVAGRTSARRTVMDPPPGPRPRRPRLLLLGLPMFAVFAAFGAIVWLAYEHGSQGPPVGEPPLVRAPATPIKLAADDSEADVAEGGEVLDMLSDTGAAGEPLERLLPPPEEPLAPVEQAAEPVAPDDAAAEVAAAEPAPDSFAIPEPQIADLPPEEPQIAALAPEEPEPQPEPQSPATIPQPTIPEPTPEEAEAALDALLAEVTEQAEAVAPEPERTGAANGAEPSEVRPAVAPPAPQPTGPSSTASAGRPSGEVIAIAPDRRPAASGSSGSVGTRPERSQTAALGGPFRIQLAAVRDEADARRAWDLFQVDLGPVLAGLEPYIERADTANGVFYRVQIGSFASLQEAEALCDQLKQRNASCFVIRR
jgi:cell division septation protein DedD